MFLKYLIIASILTTRATFGQYLQPVELNAIGSECALILPGGARSSAYDHTLNLFRVGGLNSIQDTTKTCITYDAINAACFNRLPDLTAVAIFFIYVLTLVTHRTVYPRICDLP